ncbi:putative nucleic acid-binding protein [Spirosoma lacussanchae]|uniref:type II toxin-antitoxin system VapC family toxin n=1 Tax=Spirosoma lacussanchae TaxID=1884249 RepID=UPI0011097980|nr:type II toxin-antitoxin system VapC family toxin [Spirosoma lacussanchae]
MSNKIVLDSSVLVEWAKKTQPELFIGLQNSSYELCISQITLSEFSYYWLAVGGQKAPVTLKRDGKIPTVLQQYNPVNLLTKLTWLETDERIVAIHLRLMMQYNLLPNDALILATCQLNNIKQIASYDADFETACQAEGIRLIRSVAELA